MSTIRFETSPKASPVQGSPLDDYYPSILINMDTPNLSGLNVDEDNAENEEDPNDLYAQLAQKDQDLILAAEIGKSLLEKNEELTKVNEKLTEEYTQKFEVGPGLLIEYDLRQLTPCILFLINAFLNSK